MIAELQRANQHLQLENEQLRASNAWYRARNLELLRLLSGRKDTPGDVAPARPPAPAEASAAPAHASAFLPLDAEQPPPVAAYVRHGAAHL
jgi:hypothetical protein